MRKSENNLIEWIASQFPPVPADGVLVGIGDDMAMLRADTARILVTADMLMDGVHFDTSQHSLARVGRKVVAASLSDCAAMAVRPKYAVISVALPHSFSMEQAKELFRGMERMASTYDCAIVGGDTNSWPGRLVVDVCMLAEPWEKPSGMETEDRSRGSVELEGCEIVTPIRRDGVQLGDAICVTGTLGGSLSGHHLDFDPRVGEARWLAERLGPSLHAMMDISDGLSTDAPRMAKASGCGMEFDMAAIEAIVSEAAKEASGRDGRSPIDHALHDGEDFELLFTMDAHALSEMPTAESRAKAAPSCESRPPAWTRIGTAIEEQGVWLRQADGSRAAVSPAGWQHFV